ncbi:hypothetical protein [Aurantimonas sp. HBX-1]|uniref:hypothetical protein n=1 Tax=Aurantimonas sp. HBX-1 TaxID=2906072 RepID=UPI001F30B734|nr:hypothetical protein [Aurantimonas sp. HBX-1]UIJ73354.1 hypothetical protein LXB15_06855 [Aurantimonas sp. HBX-1]
MIARDALVGLEAGQITEAEALEQAGVDDIDSLYQKGVEAWRRLRSDRRPAHPVK